MYHSPAVDVAMLLLWPLLLVLLANGDAVIDDVAVVVADTVIGVDLGTKTGALMLSADMDEKTPDPVRGIRALPLLPFQCEYHYAIMHVSPFTMPLVLASSYISVVSWDGDGLFYSDNKCSFHCISVAITTTLSK